MITCRTRRWGHSLGITIPHEQVQQLGLKENQTIVVEIVKTQNPLRELFGFGKDNKITPEEFLATRKLLESKSV